MWRVEFLTEAFRIVCVRCGVEANAKQARRDHRCEVK